MLACYLGGRTGRLEWLFASSFLLAVAAPIYLLGGDPAISLFGVIAGTLLTLALGQTASLSGLLRAEHARARNRVDRPSEMAAYAPDRSAAEF